MSLFNSLRTAVCGLWSLVVGLKITGDAFFRKQITLHYPRQTVPNLNTFRGHIELVGKNEAPATPRCIACFKCALGCPSRCISMELDKESMTQIQQRPVPKNLVTMEPSFAVIPLRVSLPGTTQPSPVSFHLNFNYCSLCGLCVQGCPVGSLRFSTNAYLAGFTRQEFEYDLMARLQKQAV